MTVRNAIAADSLRILELVQEAFSRSVYAGRGNVDHRYSREFFARCAMVRGNPNQGGTFYQVCEVDGVIEGYFLGVLDRVYQVGDKLAATDIHIYASARANPRDAITMIDNFIEWAEGNKNVIEIVVGTTALFGEVNERIEHLWERKGFARWGSMLKRQVER